MEGAEELSGNKRLQQIGFKYNPFSRDDRETRMEKSREKIGSKEGEAVEIRFSKVFAFRKLKDSAFNVIVKGLFADAPFRMQLNDGIGGPVKYFL